jgi:hypothetical protein
MVLSAVMLLGAARFASGAPLSLPYTLEARGGRLRASLDVSAAFRPELARELGNGLTNVIAVHVGLVSEKGDEPVAVYGREIEVLYDVWEESYRVSEKDVDADRPRTRRLVFQDYPSLRDHLSHLRDVDLGPTRTIASGRWVIQVRIEVNPISQELLDRTREFIANPAAGAREGGSSRSFLGTMASYLLSNTDTGTAVSHFRSASFTAREVPER